MNKIDIRPYQAQDRSSMRELCCDVADRGLPLENFFPDREVAADLLTNYYTDYEPQSTFVAISDAGLAGYISGCMDNRRYGLVMGWILGPSIAVKAFKRGLFFRPEIHRMIGAMSKNWRRLFSWRKNSFHSHQAHLHIGVRSGCRGRHVGRDLLKALIDHAVRLGADELTACVHDANQAAVVFFESQGFTVRESHPMVQLRGEKEEHYHSLLYVKTIR